jgi:WD40 repeat protein
MRHISLLTLLHAAAAIGLGGEPPRFAGGSPVSPQGQGMKPRAVLRGHPREVQWVAFSPDGKTLASTSLGARFRGKRWDGVVKWWDVKTGGELAAFKDRFSDSVIPAPAAFSPRGKILAFATGFNVTMWDTDTRKKRASLVCTTGAEYRGGVFSLAFSPDGKTLATAYGVDVLGPRWGEVKLWDVASGKVLRTLHGEEGPAWAVAFSPDGKTLATRERAAGFLAVKLWVVASGRQRVALRGRHRFGTAMGFTPDGRTLAAAGQDFRDRQTVKLWDVDTGKERATLNGHTDVVRHIVFSPDGKILATAAETPAAMGGRDRAVKLWDVEAGKERATLKGHTDAICGVLFSPDGKTLVSGSCDGTVKLWNVAAATTRATIQADVVHVRCVALSPDSKTLATGGSDGAVKVWDVVALLSAGERRGSAPQGEGTARWVCLWEGAVGRFQRLVHRSLL